MKFNHFVLFILFSLSLAVNAQPIQLYEFGEYNVTDTTTIIFTSLSEAYFQRTQGVTDTLRLSDDERYWLKQFKLAPAYRKKFLHRIGVAETDSVFFYSYRLNAFLGCCVKDLPVIACLNIYTDEKQPPPEGFSATDYMVGFKINKALLSSFKEKIRGKFYYWSGLMCIAKANPFIPGGLKPMVWRPMQPALFPADTLPSEDSALIAYWHKHIIYKYYESTIQGIHFMAKEFRDGDNNTAIAAARQLAAYDLKTGARVFTHVSLETESESPNYLSISPVESPDYNTPDIWVGTLFKNKPPVIFWLENVSFGCLRVYFLNKSSDWIDINCDNRH